MSYVIVRRNTGELVLERSTSLNLNTQPHETKAYKEAEAKMPRQPERPPAPPRPGQEVWNAKTYRWEVVEPTPEEVAKYEAALKAYEPKKAEYDRKHTAWLRRRDAWAKRRDRAVRQELRVLAPADQRYSFAGAPTKGVSLARRLRFLRAADQRRFDELDRQIIRLQEQRARLIEAAFGRGIKATPEALVKIGQGNQRDNAKRGWKQDAAGHYVPVRPRNLPASKSELERALDSRWSRTPAPAKPQKEAEAA